MEFIRRSPEPDHLGENKERWVRAWIDFYHETRNSSGELVRSSKPTDNHWTDDRIRSILISDFKNNCGYCGCARPTPRNESDRARAPRGHVDHFRAKAIYPELTYEWSNYIWSCESCNTEKGEFDDPEDPILNPCEESDCNQLSFMIDTGEYCLTEQESPCYKRFQHTDRSTMINAKEIAIKRRNRVKNLESLFESIDKFFRHNRNELFQEIIHNSIERIIAELEDKEFYFLMLRRFNELCSLYPEAASLVRKNID